MRVWFCTSPHGGLTPGKSCMVQLAIIMQFTVPISTINSRLIGIGSGGGHLQTKGGDTKNFLVSHVFCIY